MKLQVVTPFLILLAVSSMAMVCFVPIRTVHAPSAPPIVVGVFSSTYQTNNITITDGTLPAGSFFNVDVNVTNAPAFNGFETALFYDPTYITLTSYDVSTMFTMPFVAVVHNSTGAFRIGVVNLGAVHFQGSGTLLRITFRINLLGASPLVLAASTADPGGSAQGADGSKPDWTRLVVTQGSATNPVESNMTTADGYFRDIAGPTNLPPVTSFNYYPTKLAAEEPFTLNATSSFDPDKPRTQAGPGIKRYTWDFGTTTSQGSLGFVGPIFSTSYLQAGNYTILLTVVDNDTFYEGMKSLVVSVSLQPFHNLEVNTILLNGALQVTVKPNETLQIAVTILNGGTYVEHFNMTISYGPPSALIPPVFNDQTLFPGTSRSRRTYNATLSTSGLALGTYEVDVALVDHPANSAPLDKVVKAIFTISEPSSIPYIPIIGGIFAVIAIPTAIVVVRRRMRVEEA